MKVSKYQRPEPPNPVDFAEMLLDEVPNIFGCTVKKTDELSYLDVAISLQPDIEAVFPEPNRVFHRVSESAGWSLLGSSQISTDAYDIAVEICARNIVNGAPLPEGLRIFAHQLLRKGIKRPPGQGTNPDAPFGQKWILYSLVQTVCDVFGLRATRNEATSPASACDVVAEAARRHGLDLKETTLRDWCTHRDSARFRERANGLINYVKDIYLVRLGLKSRIGP